MSWQYSVFIEKEWGGGYIKIENELMFWKDMIVGIMWAVIISACTNLYIGPWIAVGILWLNGNFFRIGYTLGALLIFATRLIAGFEYGW